MMAPNKRCDAVARFADRSGPTYLDWTISNSNMSGDLQASWLRCGIRHDRSDWVFASPGVAQQICLDQNQVKKLEKYALVNDLPVGKYNHLLPVALTAGFGTGNGWKKLCRFVHSHLRCATGTVHTNEILHPMGKFRASVSVALYAFIYSEYLNTLPREKRGVSDAFSNTNPHDIEPDVLAPVHTSR